MKFGVVIEESQVLQTHPNLITDLIGSLHKMSSTTSLDRCYSTIGVGMLLGTLRVHVDVVVVVVVTGLGLVLLGSLDCRLFLLQILKSSKETTL